MSIFALIYLEIVFHDNFQECSPSCIIKLCVACFCSVSKMAICHRYALALKNQRFYIISSKKANSHTSVLFLMNNGG